MADATRSTASGSSSWPSGCSSPSPARCSPTGAPTSSAIDRPEGDPYRGLATQGIGTDSGGVNLSIALANRGKRSMALDLRTDGGQRGPPPPARRRRRAAHQLPARRPRAPRARRRRGAGALPAARLRPGPRLRRARPRRRPAGYDASAFWARGGVGHVLTPPDRDYPISQRGAFGDRNGGMALAFGIAAALLRRAPTGEGSVVDVSLLATAMWTLSSDVLSALQGATPRASDGRVDVQPAGRPPTGRRTTATSSSCSSSPTATGRRSAS